MNIGSYAKKYTKFLELFGIFQDPLIGIDISSSSIKIIELAKDQADRYVVQNFAVEKLQVGDVVEKNIKNKEAVTKALKTALLKSNIKSNLGCISIPNNLAITKIIQFNSGLTEAEILNEIEIDFDRYIPYEIEEVDLDLYSLGISKDASHLKDIMLVASKKENINLRLSLLADVGINPRVVDVDSLAVARSFKHLIAQTLPDNGKDQVIGLFDIGATSTSFNVFKDLNLVYNKEQAFGGQPLLDEIQKRYGLTLAEAILARRYNDLPDDYNVDVLEPHRNKIAQQIVRLCQLFLSSSEYNKMDYICLTGGTSNLPGLDDAIQDLLKNKVIIVNPANSLIVSPHIPMEIFQEESSGLMNCCGLGLRNLMNSHSFSNFME